MPWALVTGGFFLAVTLWIATGFLGVGFSLSLVFFPFLFGVAAFYWLHRLVVRRGGLDLELDTSAYLWLALVLLSVTLLTWGTSAIADWLPLHLSLFNLLVPATLALVPVLVWIAPVRGRDLRRLFRVVVGFAALNGLISALIFVGVNLLRLVPTEAFFLNPRYPVILFDIGGRSWVRTPGLFESGGTNGSFLLLTLALTLCYLLLAPGPKRHRGWLWALAGLQAALVLSTLTRRSMLALSVQLAIVGTAVLFLRRRRFPVAGLLLVGCAGLGAVYMATPELFGTRTLALRLDFWRTVGGILETSGPIRVLVGFGVTQSGLERLVDPRFPIIDNTFLGLWVYGGFLLLAAHVAYYGPLLYTNLRLAGRAPAEIQWLAAFNVTVFGTGLTISFFSVFLTNVSESFPYVLAFSLVTKYVLEEHRAGEGK